MISLRSFFRPSVQPSLNVEDIAKLAEEQATSAQELHTKAAEVHRVAKDFERTVKAFLDDRQAQHAKVRR